MKAGDLTTPALLADVAVLDQNLATMSAARPGPALRPHVKAFKTTALAVRLAAAGHTGFCCATIREVEGMAAAGLGDDLLLANEVVDASRLGALVRAGTARVTVAVDSSATMLELARRTVGPESHRCDFRLGDLEHLPVADGEVDAVMACMVLHHLSDPARAGCVSPPPGVP